MCLFNNIKQPEFHLWGVISFILCLNTAVDEVEDVAQNHHGDGKLLWSWLVLCKWKRLDDDYDHYIISTNYRILPSFALKTCWPHQFDLCLISPVVCVAVVCLSSWLRSGRASSSYPLILPITSLMLLTRSFQRCLLRSRAMTTSLPW